MFATPIDAEVSGAFAAMFLVLFALVYIWCLLEMGCLEWLFSVGWAAILVYLMLQRYPEKYLKPHVVTQRLEGETFESYVQKLGLLLGVAAVSAFIMIAAQTRPLQFLRLVRWFVVGLWGAIAILMGISLWATALGGGIVYP